MKKKTTSTLITRPEYVNSLVFPVWIFNGSWHIYDTTEFYYTNHLKRKHIFKCGNSCIEYKRVKFEVLGFKFMSMPHVCPYCKKIETALLQHRGYLNAQGNRIRRNK
jgi:hypothetical protein